MNLDNVASRLIASPNLTGAEALAGSQYRWRELHFDNVASRLIASPKLSGAEALAGSQYRWCLLRRSIKREPFCERTWPLASETCVGDTSRGRTWPR